MSNNSLDPDGLKPKEKYVYTEGQHFTPLSPGLYTHKFIHHL